jgi:DivIVA domain-containing protein
MMQRIVGERDVADLEARARELPRRRLGRGYRRGEVDAFTLEVVQPMRDLVRENEARRAGVSQEHLMPHAQTPMTSFDVQDRRFHRAWGGYDMRSADEYLDEVADFLHALTQENEALRSTMGQGGEGPDR